jgi:hypothetical protein
MAAAGGGAEALPPLVGELPALPTVFEPFHKSLKLPPHALLAARFLAFMMSLHL